MKITQEKIRITDTNKNDLVICNEGDEKIMIYTEGYSGDGSLFTLKGASEIRDFIEILENIADTL